MMFLVAIGLSGEREAWRGATTSCTLGEGCLSPKPEALGDVGVRKK